MLIFAYTLTNAGEQRTTTMKTEHFNIFTEKQIETIKEIIIKGFWGDADIEFGENEKTNYGLGYFTNMGKGKAFSGFMSGIAKTIDSSNTEAIKMCSDWWQDGSGDMMFFNADLLECDSDELKKWATNSLNN